MNASHDHTSHDLPIFFMGHSCGPTYIFNYLSSMKDRKVASDLILIATAMRKDYLQHPHGCGHPILGTPATGDQSIEVTLLKDEIAALEQKVSVFKDKHELRLRQSEASMIFGFEQMIMDFHQQLQQQPRLPIVDTQQNPSFRGTSISSLQMANSLGAFTPRGSFSDAGGFPVTAGAPTLPPHPLQKRMSNSGLFVEPTTAPPRGISAAIANSCGLSEGLLRDGSLGSTSSALLNGATWDDPIFAQIMLGETGELGASETVATRDSVMASEDVGEGNYMNDNTMNGTSV